MYNVYHRLNIYALTEVSKHKVAVAYFKHKVAPTAILWFK
jgi:hypothetical protein